jgi:hypothetical protein
MISSADFAVALGSLQQCFYGGTAEVLFDRVGVAVLDYRESEAIPANMYATHWRCHYCGTLQVKARVTCSQCGGERRE